MQTALAGISRVGLQGGFFVPLSGGRDSASVVSLVYSMCRLVCAAVEDGGRLFCTCMLPPIILIPLEEQVLSDVRRIVPDEGAEYIPRDARQLCGKILFTSYMATENSSANTKRRAAALAQQIGSQHSRFILIEVFVAERLSHRRQKVWLLADL